MTSEFSIRTFRYPEDYPAVRALWEDMEKGVHLGRSDSLFEIEKKIARDPDLFLLAEAGRGVVGTVIGGFDGRRGLIYHLAVRSEYRQQGLASRLMDEVEHRLREKGCLKCYLLVLDGNDEGARFYAKRGWSEMTQLHIFSKELA